LTPNGKIDRKALSLSEFTAITSEVPVETPRDSIETKLVEIWERVLEVRPIGIRTNFFDVGGYSLMIVKLFTQINQVFSRSLPIATIFHSPTIEQLATLIRGKNIGSALVPIRPFGNKTPLFIVHSYLTYDRFRKVTDQDRPLYGLHEREDDATHVVTMDDQVANYVEQIRAVQPEGPYNLIGWCAAGPLTVELARNLQNSGSEVAMVGLIDSAHPNVTEELKQKRKQRSLAERIRSALSYHQQRQAQFGLYGMPRYIWRVLRNKVSIAYRDFLLRHWKPIFALCRKLGISSPHFMYNLSTVEVKNIEPYDGRIALFRPTHTIRPTTDPSLGWGCVALQGVDIVWSPGDHETMFIEPQITEFGKILEETMEGHGVRTAPDDSAFAQHMSVTSSR
jgi:thioesterase domain-containing protein